MTNGLGVDARAAPDVERFRLRRFVDRLIQCGEAEVIETPLALGDLAARVDGNPKAVLFRAVGPEKAELVANVTASRDRLALALGVERAAVRGEINRRLARRQPIVEVPRAAAPVQAFVLEGADADLTRLPVHFQHGADGGPYISASIDYVVNPANGWTNIGARRLMLRGRSEAGVDLNAPSDLRAIYIDAAKRGAPLPVAFVVGSHPVDHVAATMRLPVDELQLLADLRGEPLAVVKCLTSDIRVPADAEFVLEGYFDARGHVEAEGPYGEFLGYYGVMKQNPVFHLTAITRRRDALFQSSSIGGRFLDRTDTSQLSALRTEVMVWRALETAIREPVAIFATPSSGGAFHIRIAMRPRFPGESRNAIAAVFGSLANAKHVFVVDDDVDIFDDKQMDWALATRFQADRDLVVQSGFRTLPLDPSLRGAKTGAKAGFDLTYPVGMERSVEHAVPAPPTVAGRRYASVEEALADGPKTFEALMAAIGTRDGREVVIALDAVRSSGRLTRLKGGEYAFTRNG
ncbi:MAG: UbiD family decarboxylase [Alphaproteobacteria bacterium]|nr:UbiD family decarboxylase [Alphaproteobacteria bacterium]